MLILMVKQNDFKILDLTILNFFSTGTIPGVRDERGEAVLLQALSICATRLEANHTERPIRHRGVGCLLQSMDDIWIPWKFTGQKWRQRSREDADADTRVQ